MSKTIRETIVQQFNQRGIIPSMIAKTQKNGNDINITFKQTGPNLKKDNLSISFQSETAAEAATIIIRGLKNNDSDLKKFTVSP